MFAYLSYVVLATVATRCAFALLGSIKSTSSIAMSPSHFLVLYTFVCKHGKKNDKRHHMLAKNNGHGIIIVPN